MSSDRGDNVTLWEALGEKPQRLQRLRRRGQTDSGSKTVAPYTVKAKPGDNSSDQLQPSGDPSGESSPTES